MWGDRYYEVKHPSGLRILSIQRSRTIPPMRFLEPATVQWTPPSSAPTSREACTVPAGIAHYLEHKLFESEDGDAFARYARPGANANAYTSFDVTCYLLLHGECLRVAGDSAGLCAVPYFTGADGAKGTGHHRPGDPHVRRRPAVACDVQPVGGAVSQAPGQGGYRGYGGSIAQITPELLYRCYHTFYNLNNMVLCVAGNVELNKVLDLCDRMLKPSAPVEIERIFEEEPRARLSSRVWNKLSVVTPLFELGFKGESREPATTKELAETEILLELMASDASPLFRRLLDAGLVNESSFGYEYF